MLRIHQILIPKITANAVEEFFLKQIVPLLGNYEYLNVRTSFYIQLFQGFRKSRK
jgi:hypothetical protein